MKMNYTTILWDWNGTLLNDTDFCISIVNGLLTARNKEALTKERYLEIFNFPVKEYYKKAGFDFSKEEFKIPADQFIENYNRELTRSTDLHSGAKDILGSIQEKGQQQIILSAMEQVALRNSIEHHKIDHYFNEISGINNHYAASKKENGLELIKKLKIDASKTCFIGDTIHDHEVAEALGCDCILIAGGHQSKTRLESTKRLVLNNLTELADYL